MTLLHDFFTLRNRQAFQRLLDDSDRGSVNTGLSTSGGRSWNRSSSLTSVMALDVNARDWLGRTVLHLACASMDSLEYVKLLLRHQHINVNLPDTESHWTPLHRAMYQANFSAALLLLQRTDTDRSLQDYEGYTAFDLYNSTINETKPRSDESFAELYTWGVNRNAALGLGDGSDRTYPDQVIIQRKDEHIEGQEKLEIRFSPVLVRQIQMSKLHTAVITSESIGNLRVCGFGNGGRLGHGQHTQYSLKALPQFTQTIVSVALGQDHTLALTKSGEVLSWGLNRFAQLGYVVESAPGEGFGRTEEPIQFIPKKISGSLRKELVKGIAASKGASACWTRSDVYTWGTNNGQLGYDKAAQPVQILPRKASKVTYPVVALSLTDNAMACLLETHDVICIWNDRQIKIPFPGHAFPAEMQPHRPPEAIQDAKIAKITSCEDTFAALALNGELFTFTVPGVTESDGAPGKERPSFKPQRVWALRKKFSAVKDVALGSDGSIIICTESGHVFVRTRTSKAGQFTSGKAFKFQRVPTGAFGALRVEHKPRSIEVHGNTLAQDVAEPQERVPSPSRSGTPLYQPIPRDGKNDEEQDDLYILNDIQKLRQLLDVIAIQKRTRHEPPIPTGKPSLPYGADVVVHGSSKTLFPAHRILDGSKVAKDTISGISLRLLRPMKLVIDGCHPISILILLRYLYSDDLLVIWDGRTSTALGGELSKANIQPAQIKVELGSLATLLNLPHLAQSLESTVKRTPIPSMQVTMERLFEMAQNFNLTEQRILSPDVILQLADREIRCHSIILRARSQFFADFFNEGAWTVNRWNSNGIITINMKHLTWRVMDYVLRFMCCGADAEMFITLDSAGSVDEVLEFVFDVMAAANELLLDRLVLICSAVILNHLSLNKACFILSDAAYLHAGQLTERLETYITVNMELFLTTGMLDDIPTHLIDRLAQFARQKQIEKYPISRSNRLALQAIAIHSDWLALQDIPHPVPRSNVIPRKDPLHVKSSPSRPKLLLQTPVSDSLYERAGPRSQGAIPRPQTNEDIFTMDNADVAPIPKLTPLPATPTPRLPVWKAPSKPRVDMIAVMAEAATTSSPHHYPSSVTRDAPIDLLKVTSRPRSDPQSMTDTRSPASGSGSTHISLTPKWRPTQGVETAHPPAANTTSTLTSSDISGKKDIHPANLGYSPRSKPNIPHTPHRVSGGSSDMGPMITPTRQSTSSASPYASTIRRTSGKAWNQPSVTSAATSSPSTSGMSLLAIQQLELAQIAGAGKEKRSLREIQEEEKSLQEEADFLTWWTAEEARIKAEIEAATIATASQKVRSMQSTKRSGKKVVRSDGTSRSKADHPKRPPRKAS
ncbi:hypothetical protein BDZ94DRAFT_1345506 [Collybia nuda]|uniref:BTB domain-containing protein n=1 Tax=Collybia nuda TaxID=64659 RepID=A0A9P5XSF8_9AGAR|nr:hypothetical protein BDZ94DRAFT_1345506 [Collybia nuda]